MRVTNPTGTITAQQTATGFVDDISTYAWDMKAALKGSYTIQNVIKEVTTTTQWKTGIKQMLYICNTMAVQL